MPTSVRPISSHQIAASTSGLDRRSRRYWSSRFRNDSASAFASASFSARYASACCDNLNRVASASRTRWVASCRAWFSRVRIPVCAWLTASNMSRTDTSPTRSGGAR